MKLYVMTAMLTPDEDWSWNYHEHDFSTNETLIILATATLCVTLKSSIISTFYVTQIRSKHVDIVHT